MSKMKKISLALGIIVFSVFLVFCVTKVFAQDDHYGYFYKCGTCESNGVTYPFFWTQEKTNQCPKCKATTNIEQRVRYVCKSKCGSNWGSISEKKCPNCSSTDVYVLTEKTLKGAIWPEKVSGLETKFQKTFYKTRQCENGHIYTATGSYYDNYGWELDVRQTDIEICPYAGCGAKGTVYKRQNIVHIRGLEMASTFDNLYCVAHGQDMDKLIQYKGAYFDAKVKVEINGDIAKFYEYDSNTDKYIYRRSVVDDLNNKMAAILSAENIEKGYASNYDRYEQYETGANGGVYQEAQLLVYKYWNKWVETTGGTLFGLETDAGNQGKKNDENSEEMTRIEKLYNNTELNNKLDLAISNDKEYSATIYFLKYNCNNSLIESRVITYNQLLCYSLVVDKSGKTVLTSDNKESLQELILVDFPVYVTKVWYDNNNSAGTRPESITVELYADGVSTGKKLTLTGPDWTGKFEELDRKDSNGKIITYTVKEVDVPGYTSTITGDQYAGYTITNTIIPVVEKTKVMVEKVWSDNGDANGNRPESIEVALLASGVETGKTLTLNEGNNWKGTFEDLAKESEGGDEILYTVKELNVENYTTEYKRTTNGDVISYIITNTPIKTTEVTVTKVWYDQDDRDGKRPDSIIVRLDSNNIATQQIEKLNKQNNWKYTFTNLPETDENGVKITYTVKEIGYSEGTQYYEGIPSGYTSSGPTGDQYVGYTITNTRNPEEIEIEVIKKWEDGDNQEGLRPSEITVELYIEGMETQNEATLTLTGPHWSGKFTGLYKYINGEEINYKVREVGYTIDGQYYEGIPEGYTTTEPSGSRDEGYIITNTRIPTKIRIIKIWDENAENIPSSINITLYEDSAATKEVETVTLSKDNDWKWESSELPEYKNGEKVYYRIIEETVNGYNPMYTRNQIDENGIQTLELIVTNSCDQSTTKVKVDKVWEDNDNSEGLRPSEIEVILYANYAGKKEEMDRIILPVPENNNGEVTHTFENLPKYINGEKVEYTVEETQIEYYEEPVYSDPIITEDETTITITNKRTPTKITVTVLKVWDDNNDAEGYRPQDIYVTLYANGDSIETVTLNEETKWTYTFNNLDEYKDGEIIEYKVEEDKVEGYDAIYTRTEKEENGNKVVELNVTNTRNQSATKVTVVKKWADNENSEDLRPSEIEVILYANYAGKKEEMRRITLTVPENNDEELTYTFENLPKYLSGDDVEYTVEETPIEYYENPVYSDPETTEEGTTITITNKRTPTTTKVTVSKKWEDNENRDRIRPTEINVTLYADGEAIETVTLNEANQWSYTFNDLVEYENGQRIEYIIEEETVSGYESTYSKQESADGTIFTITNTHTPEKINIEVEKVWDDGNNIEGFRPNSITVQLYKNDVAMNGKIKTLNQNNNWSAEFTGLHKYENGVEINYEVRETRVPEKYTLVENGNKSNNYTIKNERIPEKINIKAQKTWNDENNIEGFRPNSITVQLYKNDVAMEGKTKTLNQNNNWSAEFVDLHKYENGREITYTVKETRVPENYILVENGRKSNNYTITNMRTPEKINIEVEKAWDDEDNIEGFRPNSITVELYKNGRATGQRETLRPDNWKATFTDLYKYENGVEITYEVREIDVSNWYTTTQGDENNNYTITNKRIPEKISVGVTKNWNDANNLQEIRPTSIEVGLYANDVLLKTEILTQDNNWQHTFEDLYKYQNATEVKYTVKEMNLPEGYESKITGTQERGYTITNTAEINYPGYIEIRGKVWLDRRDGKGNDINGKLDDDESGLKDIKVVLKDKDGNQFDSTSLAYTDGNGNYIIKVNYDNSENVYKLYENVNTVQEKLKTAYVEFEYNAMKYTTVANADTGADTSKAIENEDIRNAFDKSFSTVTSTTNPSTWQNVQMIANTQNVISFANYVHKSTINREEILKICAGNGKYILSNPKYPWNNVLTGYCNSINHPEMCSGKPHTLGADDVEVTIISNVNLGLFEREQPDVAIISDLSEVKVTIDDQDYTYVYGSRDVEIGPNRELKVELGKVYKRPLNAADITHINSEAGAGKQITITAQYKVKAYNLSTTVPITIHNITNYYDPRLTLTNEGWNTTLGNDFNQASYNGDLNKTVNPMGHTEIILTYEVSQDSIKELLNENMTLSNAVEIQSYSTQYGETTLYAEQRTGGRTGNAYGGYDYNSHPGNAGIFINAEGRLEAARPEDDTDIAPGLVVLGNASQEEKYYKILSGNVWEDSDLDHRDKFRVGDGNRTNLEPNNVANVKVELYRVKEDGTLELAKLYSNSSEVKTIDAITYTDANGYYAFGNEEYSAPTDTYVIKFTYGTGIDGSKDSSINGTSISARDYKSTIISSNNTSVFNVFKGSNNDEWHLNTNKGYSIAVDDIEQRIAISDLQYGNYENPLSISAYSKQFTVPVEFDPNVGKTSSVDKNGLTIYSNELNIFDFGIIERAKEDITVQTTIDYMKITLANGQVLTEGNPSANRMNYAKAVGFNQPVMSLLEKQIVVEMDTELLQGAKLETKYKITVTNNSESDIDYYVGTEFYYFGTNNERAPEIKDSVNQVVAYLDSEFTYSGNDLTDKWTQAKAEDLYNGGLISPKTYDKLMNNNYIVYVTDKASELKPGDVPVTTEVYASKLLANKDDNIYDIQAEILEVDTKTARTISGKQYKMGNYVPGLEQKTIYKVNGITTFVPVGAEKAGYHEQDDDRLKIIITPPTGLGTYIVRYLSIGLAGLIAIAVVIIFIKKKVSTKKVLK